jgi:hypothetical protein
MSIPNEDSLRDSYDRQFNNDSVNSPNWEHWDMDPGEDEPEKEEEERWEPLQYQPRTKRRRSASS